MRGNLPARFRPPVIASLALAIACGAAKPVRADEPAITNILQLRAAAAQNPGASHFIRLQGNVWWANPAQSRVVLQDDTGGAAQLELDLQGKSVHAGQRMYLEGNATIARR